MSNLIYFRPEGSDLTLVGNGNREEGADPDAYSSRVGMDFVEDIWARLAKRIPDIADGEFFTGYAGLYTTTPDLHPVIDRVDGIDGYQLSEGARQPCGDDRRIPHCEPDASGGRRLGKSTSTGTPVGRSRAADSVSVISAT